jgi:hypothetical protein
MLSAYEGTAFRNIMVDEELTAALLNRGKPHATDGERGILPAAKRRASCISHREHSMLVCKRVPQAALQRRISPPGDARSSPQGHDIGAGVGAVSPARARVIVPHQNFFRVGSSKSFGEAFQITSRQGTRIR